MQDVDPFTEQLRALGADEQTIRVIEKVAIDMARTLTLTLEEAKTAIIEALTNT